MKAFKTILFLTFALSIKSFAVDFRQFSGKNYEPIRRDYCGSHVEISNGTIYVTSIIPPSLGFKTSMCGSQGYFKTCVGQSYKAECDSDGKCYIHSKDGTETKLALTLLEDGNIYVDFWDLKLIKSNVQNVKVCGTNIN